MKKNLIYLKYSDNYFAGGANHGYIFYIVKNIEHELSNFDGLIVVDGGIQIFSKNSNFIKGKNLSQNKCYHELDYVLSEILPKRN